MVSLILYHKNTTHLSSSHVSLQMGSFFLVVCVGWQDFGQAADYLIRSQVCSTFWSLETLLWLIGGFDIENILQGSTGLNIPPLLRTSLKTQLDKDGLEETRCIVSLHVHVEQAMERIKNSYH